LQLRGRGKIASLSGRFYAMDRDHNYTRTQKCYDALVFGQGKVITNPEEYLRESYENGVTDEFLIPALINPAEATIKDNDALIFLIFEKKE